MNWDLIEVLLLNCAAWCLALALVNWITGGAFYPAVASALGLG